MKTYRKLVRDKIPTIIENDGKKCEYIILDNNEYLIELNKKLKEEIDEYLLDNSVMELCDIEEVILSILDARGISREEFEKLREEKARKNGGFKNKIFLLNVKDD